MCFAELKVKTGFFGELALNINFGSQFPGVTLENAFDTAARNWARLP